MHQCGLILWLAALGLCWIISRIDSSSLGSWVFLWEDSPWFFKIIYDFLLFLYICVCHKTIQHRSNLIFYWFVFKQFLFYIIPGIKWEILTRIKRESGGSSIATILDRSVGSSMFSLHRSSMSHPNYLACFWWTSYQIGIGNFGRTIAWKESVALFKRAIVLNRTPVKIIYGIKNRRIKISKSGLNLRDINILYTFWKEAIRENDT